MKICYSNQFNYTGMIDLLRISVNGFVNVNSWSVIPHPLLAYMTL